MPSVSELAREENEGLRFNSASDELASLYSDMTLFISKDAKTAILRRIRELEEGLGLTSLPYNSSEWYERSTNALRSLRRGTQ